MFTGIVQAVGHVREIVSSSPEMRRITLETRMNLSNTDIGASIACAGCCLTVVARGADWFSVDVSAETLGKTTLGGWDVGTAVNLEPALRMGEEIGGHLLSGHIDGVARIKGCTPEGECVRVRISPPPALLAMIAPKGCVAIDGVSLTVNEVRGGVFGVNLIPHTLAHTTFKTLKTGDRVHIEADLIARYVSRVMGCAAPSSAKA